MHRIKIEPTFDRSVKLVGGCRVKDLFGENPGFPNADYYFPDHKIVAELKELDKDHLSDSKFQNKISLLYASWVDKGLVPPAYGIIDLITEQLPPECAVEYFDLLKSRLEDPSLRKANRQIRETKKKLEEPEAVGLLLLANNGNVIFDPGVTFNLLNHSLRNQYRSIDRVIYFSANLALNIEGIGPDCLLWADVEIKDRRPMNQQFLDCLHEAWVHEVGKELGNQAPIVKTEVAVETIDRLRFRTPRRDD